MNEKLKRGGEKKRGKKKRKEAIEKAVEGDG